jgi:sugar phosphate isomerase/epimerase
MDKHWNNYCTMSIVHFMAFPNTIGGEGPIVETLTKIAEDPFFGAVEIGWIKDPQVRAATKSVLNAAHIQVGYGAQSALLLQKLNLNSLDEAERKKALDQLMRCIDEAEEMGAQRVAFLSGKDPGEADRLKALDLLIDSTKRVCAHAAKKGIAMTCEVFDRDIDKKCLIGPCELSAAYASAVRQDYPEFGLMYDLSHRPLLFEEAEPALAAISKHLVHIHVGNAVVVEGLPGYGDLHPRFGWPGSANDVPEMVDFVRALFKVGYLKDGPARPWVGFEIKPQGPGETPELVIAGAKRVWQDAWSRV